MDMNIDNITIIILSIFISIVNHLSPKTDANMLEIYRAFYSISISSRLKKESSMASSKNCSTSSLPPNMKHPSNKTLICYWIY